MLHEHKLSCLDSNESINVIFKGGNVMSFFYNDTLSYFTTEKKLDVKLGEHIGYKYKGSSKSSYSNDTLLLYATEEPPVLILIIDIYLLS